MDARQRFLEVELQSKEQESQRINAMNERDLSNMKLAADREDQNNKAIIKGQEVEIGKLKTQNNTDRQTIEKLMASLKNQEGRPQKRQRIDSGEWIQIPTFETLAQMRHAEQE